MREGVGAGGEQLAVGPSGRGQEEEQLESGEVRRHRLEEARLCRGLGVKVGAGVKVGVGLGLGLGLELKVGVGVGIRVGVGVRVRG